MRRTIAKALKLAAAGGTLAAIATTGFAETQGTLGFTSTGDLNITMNVTDDLRISNLADINFLDFAGADQTVTSPACVYRNGGAPNTDYTITALGDGLGGTAFTITGAGSGFSIPYTVNYTDSNNTAPLTTGVAYTANGAVTTNNDCLGGDNGLISVTITNAAASSVPADAYSGVLTLTVGPV